MVVEQVVVVMMVVVVVGGGGSGGGWWWEGLVAAVSRLTPGGGSWRSGAVGPLELPEANCRRLSKVRAGPLVLWGCGGH